MVVYSYNMPNKLLYEVSFMRPIIIVLVVLMHSFTMYAGNWSLPMGVEPCRLYWWIGQLSFSFLLEAFVFISGYLFASQWRSKCVGNFLPFVLKKLKRLYLPCIVLSSLYYACFYSYDGIWQCFYSIVNGCGHLWFLPMLFWCFVFAFALQKISMPTFFKIIVLLLLSIGSGMFGFLPLRIGSSFYYLLFFYLGILAFNYRELFIKRSTLKVIITAWCVFAVLVVIGLLVNDTIRTICPEKILTRIIQLCSITTIKLIYSLAGVFALYLTSLHVIKCHLLSIYYIKFSDISFGIYLYHQFFLIALYYHTELPTSIGSLGLPWIGFVIAFICSVLLAWLTSNSKYGRYLIG